MYTSKNLNPVALSNEGQLLVFIVLDHTAAELLSVYIFDNVLVLGDWFWYAVKDTIHKVYLK